MSDMSDEFREHWIMPCILCKYMEQFIVTGRNLVQKKLNKNTSASDRMKSNVKLWMHLIYIQSGIIFINVTLFHIHNLYPSYVPLYMYNKQLSQEFLHHFWLRYLDLARDHSVYAPSQWGMALQGNAISHWLGAYTELSLSCIDLARNGNSGCANENSGCAKCHFWWKSPWKLKNFGNFRVCK